MAPHYENACPIIFPAASGSMIPLASFLVVRQEGHKIAKFD